MNPTDPTTDDVKPKLASLRMFLTVFTLVQIVVAGVLVFSIAKMNLALLPHRSAPYGFFAAAVAVVLLETLLMRRILLSVRWARREEPEMFGRFTSEVLIRAFLLNVPAVILLAGFALTKESLLLPPAAAGMLVVWLTRPSRLQFEEWRAGL